MEKLIYLIWAPRTADPDELKRELLREVAPRLLALGPLGLSMNIDDAQSDVPAPLPWPADETPFRAEVSLWLDCHERREPYEKILAQVGSARAGYLVSESLYSDYGSNRHSAPRDWPDGQRSPGVLTVTLLEKPDRLEHDEWLRLWHGTQSPVSEAVQPRTRYVRNTVVQALTPGAPPYRGIVDEAWPSARHVTDPLLFYNADGSPEQMKRNIERMMASVNAFLDLARIRNVTMSEYLLRSFGRRTPAR